MCLDEKNITENVYNVEKEATIILDLKKFNKENLTGILFILVPLIGFLLFTALSMGVSIYYSFTDFNPIREETKWVWFENYEKLFSGVLNT